MCEDYENNSKYINLGSDIIPIADINRISMDNERIVRFECNDDSFYTILPKIGIDADIILAFVNDIMNNMYDDFVMSSVYDLLCRKLFIYLTHIMCEEFGSPAASNNLVYIDSNLSSLIVDCSTISCRIEFSKQDGYRYLAVPMHDVYTFWAKHREEERIKFNDNDHYEKFIKMYNDWILLKEIVENFEIYD